MKPARPASEGSEHYVFDGFVVDVAAHTLACDGRAIPLEPKAFAVLIAMLRRPGELLGRDELLDGIWGHRHVTPGVLTRAIAQLRSALGDDPQRPRYIQTRHALGYRFVGELQAQERVVPAPVDPGLVAPVAAPAAPPRGAVAGASDALDPHGAGPEPDTDVQATVSRAAGERWPHVGQRQWWLASALAALVLAASWLWNPAFRGTPAPAGTSIAVLPFASISSDPGDAYFAEGLAVEMHDALAGVEGLTLAAQMSADDPRRDQDVKALGAALGVSSVLKASVRREGRRVRISAQLSDTATGYSVWSNTYDRELADIFETQAEIAGEVAEALVDMLPAQRAALAERLRPTTNVAAFDLYLRGLGALRATRDDGEGGRALSFFTRALSADAGFARAQAGICRVEVDSFRDRNDAAAFARARESCARARAMDPDLGEVNLALAELHEAHGDHARALDYYARAEANPATRVAAHVGQAILHAGRGQSELANAYFQRALAKQPANPRIHSQVAYQHYLAGRLPQSIASYRRAVDLDPGNALLWSYLGGVYLVAGQVADAESALVRSLGIAPTYSALTNLGEIRYLSGRHREAMDLQRQAVALDPSDHVTWGNLGQAQLADPATAGQASQSFAEAAARAERYLRIDQDDARTLAALGWYRANLGQADAALELVARSEATGLEPGEVALLNAQTLARLGDRAEALERVGAARAAGIMELRITGNAALQGLAAKAPPAMQHTAPSPGDGSTRGG